MDAADGSGRTRLTEIPGNDHWPPTWSPDGTRIAFTSDDTKSKGGDLRDEYERLGSHQAYRRSISGGPLPHLAALSGLIHTSA